MTGRARVFTGGGDDINTDYIISSRRKRDSLDPQVLRRYLFEDIAPGFADTIEPGDILVAGDNFGCGSAMEVAVTAVLGAGIRAVLALGFSRTYFRNAVNNGLLPVISDTRAIREGDPVSIEAEGVRNLRTGEILAADTIPAIMQDILDAGGLVPYMRQHGDFPS